MASRYIRAGEETGSRSCAGPGRRCASRWKDEWSLTCRATADQRVGEVAAVPDIEFRLTASPGEISILPGAPTRVWHFTAQVLKGPRQTLQPLPGSYLGPVIRLRRGQRVRIHFVNELSEPSVVHWHGLDVPEAADGHPRRAIGRGRESIYDFEVTNRAGTYWYHPHPHMRTGAQVYYGLRVCSSSRTLKRSVWRFRPEKPSCYPSWRIATSTRTTSWRLQRLAHGHDGRLSRRPRAGQRSPGADT